MTTPVISPSSTLQTEQPQTLASLLPGSNPNSQNAVLSAWVTENYQRIANARKATERQWYINLAFYFGKQYVTIATTNSATNSFKLYVPPAPPWRVRLTINKIRPIIRKEMATLFGQKPRFTVVPASTEDVDLIAARAGEQIFDWIYDSKKVGTTTKAAGWWACITGTGFLKSYWDSSSYDGLNTVKGDICIEAVTPFNIFVPDFQCMDIEQQPYVIYGVTKSKAYCQSTWPGLKDVQTTTQAILDDSFLNIQGAKNIKQDQILVLECWVKPGAHPLLPKGGLITIVGGQVPEGGIVEGYPYQHNKYPFAKIENIPSGKFYGEAMMSDLIPLQKEYNRTRSQITEAKNMMGKPKLMAPRGSVDASKITSEPGQVILYQPGFNPPTPLQMPNLPEYILQVVEQLDADMQDIAGSHDVSNGQMSPGTSATALSFLQEQDDTMLADTTDSLEDAIEKIGQLVLAYTNQYWNEQRKIKILGTDGAFDASAYSATDLRGNCDLRVESGSALPTSKAAKQAFIMDLLKLGVVPPDQALELLEIGGIEKVYDDFLADKHQAQRENIRMQAGTGLYVNEWDNHQVHITVHNRFRKSTTFEMLEDETKVLFQNHVVAHMAALINQNQGDPTGSGDDTQLPNEQPPPQALPPGPEGDPSLGMAGQPPPPDPTMDPSQAPAPTGGQYGP